MAPNKKYLSLEEAAVQLGVKVEELIRLREKGEVRGFADRGTWKFKADDVAEFRRRRHPDSDPDLPIMDDLDEDEDELGRQATVIRHGSGEKSDSDVRLSTPGDQKKSKSSETGGDMPTISMQKSDSDVRLFKTPPTSSEDSDSDVKLVKPKKGSDADSDSDVKIIDSKGMEDDSDSDVKLLEANRSLVDSDSDVRLSGSDSDVRLAPLLESDSDVKLIGGKSKPTLSDSDSDVTLMPKGPKGSSSKKTDPIMSGATAGDIDFDLGGDDEEVSVLDSEDSSISFPGDSGIRLSGDSGIRLAGDSGIRLSDDSGIKLQGDSGIRLGGLSGIRLGGDSGIRLADDSGVQLKHAADSGISLEGDSGIKLSEGSGLILGDDSGINLMGASSSSMRGGKGLKGSSSKHQKAGPESGKLKGGSSKKLKGKAPESDDLEATAPMRMPDLDDDLNQTSPLLSASDSGDTSAADLDLFNPSDTSELQSMGDSGHNVVMFEDDEDESPPVQTKRKQQTVEESIFEIDDTSEEQLDELEVSDDDLSGDGDFEEGAFDDEEEALDESFTTGASHVGIGTLQKVAVAPEVEWSAGFCSLLFGSMCCLIVGAVISVDLLRTTWALAGNTPVDNGWVAAVGGLWK